MAIEINITTGGLTEIGKRFTYHIWSTKDTKRVTNKLKKVVEKYPPNVNRDGIGQRVIAYAKDPMEMGQIEVTLENAKDVDDFIHDIRMHFSKNLIKKKEMLKA